MILLESVFFMAGEEEMFKTIVYHLIGDPRKELNYQQKRMFVSSKNFETHISTLQQLGYRFITLDEAEKQLEGKMPSLGNEILITFDDGYSNTIDVALPILEKYNVHAAMSICGSYIYPETRENINMHADKNFASAQQIKKWIKKGNYILAHTYSHFKLTHLTENKYKDEIEKDFFVLQKEFGKAPNGIAYPFGSTNDDVISVVKQYYLYGFATDMGAVVSWENRFRIKRICAESDCTVTELLTLLED